MSKICAKISGSGKDPQSYRVLLPLELQVYPPLDEMIREKIPYQADSSLEEGEWYYLVQFSNSEYALDFLKGQVDAEDSDFCEEDEIGKIEYLFLKDGETYYFQKVGKAKLMKKKRIFKDWNSDRFRYEDQAVEIVIQDLPDAVYDRNQDFLYFRKLSSITGIFKGIGQLYREATEQEVKEFLQSDFLCLTDGFDSKKVTIPVRKKIAAATDALKNLNDTEKERIFSYTREYCPDLNQEDGRFLIRSEPDLKAVLYGIEQRYYTTIVGNEHRIAKSVIHLEGQNGNSPPQEGNVEIEIRT